MKWLGRRMMTLPVFLGLCQDERKFKKELLRLKLTETWPWLTSDHADATTHFLHNDKGDRTVIVCIRNKPGITLCQAYALLVHESVHVWQEVKEIIGEREPSKEFEAYSIQAIAQELMVAYRHPTKRPR